jgi:VWFA-related protein
VATYSGIQGVRLLHGFTSDREQTSFAIETLGAPQLVRLAPDPLGLTFGNLEGSIRAVQNQGRGGGARAEALLEFTRTLEGQERRQMGERINDLSTSLADLARLLNNTPGRKHIVYLSEGFDTSTLFGTQDRGAQERMNQAIEDGRIWEVDSDERFGDSHSQNQLENMFKEFRRADCTLQTVNIGGLRSAANVEQGSRRDFERNRATLSGQDDSLSLMAGATGGEYIRNFNDLSQAMGEVLERTALTYVLTFQPSDLKLDGKFHRLKIRLKDGPKGARLVHRPGYYAPLPFAETSPQARRLQTAGLLLGGAQGGSLNLAALAVPSLPSTTRKSPTENQTSTTNWVPVLMSLDGKSLTSNSLTQNTPGVERRPSGTRKMQLEVYAYAMDDAGTVCDYLSHSMTIDPAQAGPQLIRGGLLFFGHLNLSPGSYNLRFLVRNNQDGTYGLRHQRLLVPEFAPGQKVVLQPLFLGTPGRALMVREDLAPGEQLPPYPFLLDDQPFLPAVLAHIPHGGSATAALFLHGFVESPQIIPRIYTAEGSSASGAEISIADPIAGPEPGVWRATLTLQGSSLPTGKYRLEVRVGEGKSHRTAFEIDAP